MEIETRDIERIVRQVMAAMEQQGTIAGGAYPPAPGTPGPRAGFLSRTVAPPYLPFTNFVGDFKVYFLNTAQKCL